MDSYTKHCSGADYEHKNWHNAYVSIEECGQDACGDKIFVDGKEVKNFDVVGPQDCTSLWTSPRSVDLLAERSKRPTSVLFPNCASCVSSMRSRLVAPTSTTPLPTLTVVDEVVIYNTTVGRAQIAQQLFHLPGHLPIDDFGWEQGVTTSTRASWPGTASTTLARPRWRPRRRPPPPRGGGCWRPPFRPVDVLQISSQGRVAQPLPWLGLRRGVAGNAFKYVGAPWRPQRSPPRS